MLAQVRVGMVLVPFQVPRNPKVVVPFGATVPFQLSLRTVTYGPVWVCRVPQLGDRLAAGQAQVAVQPANAGRCGS